MAASPDEPVAARYAAAPPILLVTATTREADDLAEALACLLPADRVATFPSWETLPHERLSPRSDTVGRRLAVLRRLAHPDPDDPAYGPLSVVVAPVRAVLQPVARGLGELAPVALRPGDEAPLEDVVDALAAAAYTRTDLVERRGEFAVRGGILDVFPPTEEHPVRVEFWGDTVEEIRWFKVADQRSLEIAQHGLWAPPCRELLLTDAVRQRARRARRRAARRSATCWPSSPRASRSRAWSRSCRSCWRTPAVCSRSSTCCRPVRWSSSSTPSASALGRTTSSRRAPSSSRPAGWVRPPAVPCRSTSRACWGRRRSGPWPSCASTPARADLPWWTLTSFASDAELAEFTDPDEGDELVERIDLATTDVEPFRGDTEAAVAQLRAWVADGLARRRRHRRPRPGPPRPRGPRRA